MEVKYRDTWGTICDDHWSLREANVVCRSLGYGSAAMATKNSNFGRGVGKVTRFLREVFEMMVGGWQVASEKSP